MTLDDQATKRQQFRRSCPVDVDPVTSPTSPTSHLHLPLHEHKTRDPLDHDEPPPVDRRLLDPLDHRQINQHPDDPNDPLDHRLRDHVDHRHVDIHDAPHRPDPIETRTIEGQKGTGRRLPDPLQARAQQKPIPQDDTFFDRARDRMTIHLNDGYNDGGYNDGGYSALRQQSTLHEEYEPIYDHRRTGQLDQRLHG
ncbi:hypothetical protein FHG87_022660, partial [Trinorchestia longiramus]